MSIVLPVIVLIMLTGLVLSRIWQPEPPPREPEVHISPFDAADYIGIVAEVCGVVESADFIRTIDGEPTFLNMGRAYPEQPFTAVIWGNDRRKWNPPPEHQYLNREICITGEIDDHDGTPQIRVADPGQVALR